MYFVEYEWKYELNSSNADDFINGKTQSRLKCNLSFAVCLCAASFMPYSYRVDLWMSFCRKYFIDLYIVFNNLTRRKVQNIEKNGKTRILLSAINSAVKYKTSFCLLWVRLHRPHVETGRHWGWYSTVDHYQVYRLLHLP